MRVLYEILLIRKMVRFINCTFWSMKRTVLCTGQSRSSNGWVTFEFQPKRQYCACVWRFVSFGWISNRTLRRIICCYKHWLQVMFENQSKEATCQNQRKVFSADIQTERSHLTICFDLFILNETYRFYLKLYVFFHRMVRFQNSNKPKIEETEKSGCLLCTTARPKTLHNKICRKSVFWTWHWVQGSSLKYIYYMNMN